MSKGTVSRALLLAAAGLSAACALESDEWEDIGSSEHDLYLAGNSAAMAGPQNMRASFARPIRSSDGHVDSVKTLNRLLELGVDTHMFMVADKQDWDDLRLSFAPAAQWYGIKVWVYLLPPSHCADPECDDYLPYKDNYISWAVAIAQLSKQYPGVTAWVIDDFANAANLDHLTPSYLSSARQASRAIQPTLEFYPVVYHQHINQTFVNNYASLVGAVIMPFRDGVYRNTAWMQTLRSHMDTARTLLAVKSRKLIVMVYARGLSETEIRPDVDYVRTITQVVMRDYLQRGFIAGIVHYSLSLIPGQPVAGDWNYSHGSGRGALAFVLHAGQATSVGDHVYASNSVRLNTGSTSCRVRIRHIDNRGTTATRGIHFIQLLASSQVMWEQDVAADDAGENGYHVSPWLDISSYMGSGSTSLRLRLYEKRNVSDYAVRVRLDDLETSGCRVSNPSFESAGHWVLGRSDGPLHGALHIYDPVYSTTVFNMLADMFAL